MVEALWRVSIPSGSINRTYDIAITGATGVSIPSGSINSAGTTNASTIANGFQFLLVQLIAKKNGA